MRRAVAFPILALLVVAIAAAANYAVYESGAAWFVQTPSFLVVIRNVAAVAGVLFVGWLLIPENDRTRSAETFLLVAATLFGVGLAMQFRLGHDAPRQLSEDQVAVIADSVRRTMPSTATEEEVSQAATKAARRENAILRREFEQSRIDARLARSLERAYGPTQETRQILDARETAPSDNPIVRFFPVLAAVFTIGLVARSNLATLLSSYWRAIGLYGSIVICLFTLFYLLMAGGIRGADFAPQEVLKVSLPAAWAGLLIHYRGAFQAETRLRFTRSPLVLWLYVLLLLSSPLVVFIVVRDFGQFLVISIAQMLLLAYFTRSALYVILFLAGTLASSAILLGSTVFVGNMLWIVLGIVIGAVVVIGALEGFRRRDALWISASFVLMIYVAVAYVAVQLPFVARMLETPRQRFLLWADLFTRHGNVAWWDSSRQIIEALYAFDAGGLVGHGIGLGTPFLIPKAASDFIFAAVGEELGFAGAAMVIISFAALVAIGLRIAKQLGGDTYPALLIAGYTLLIGSQAFVHIAGTMNILPMTGITLPLVSSGMSSLIVSWGMIGIIVGLSAREGNAGERLVIVERSK